MNSFGLNPYVDKCSSSRHRIHSLCLINLLCLIPLLCLIHLLRLTRIRSHHQSPFAVRHRHSLRPILPIQCEENAIMNEGEPLRGGVEMNFGPRCIRSAFARHFRSILFEADEPPVPFEKFGVTRLGELGPIELRALESV